MQTVGAKNEWFIHNEFLPQEFVWLYIKKEKRLWTICLYYLCPQELEAIRDALTPTLVCVAAKIGDIEALEAIREMVRYWYRFKLFQKNTCTHFLEWLKAFPCDKILECHCLLNRKETCLFCGLVKNASAIS